MAATSVEEIRREMQRIRGELPGDMQRVVVSARTLTDWRLYVASYPWLCLGAAAFLGYWVVPRARTRIVHHRPLVSKKPTKNSYLSQLMSYGASSAASMLAHGLMSYAATFIANESDRKKEKKEEGNQDDQSYRGRPARRG
jgi:hypothetical protein